MKIKVDIGGGYRLKAGFLRLDVNSSCKPDIVADAQRLPFSDSSIDEIYCAHVLEHLQNPKQCVKEIWRVLKPRGKATVVVPNIHLPWTIYIMWKYGGRETPYEDHKWRTNRGVLERILVAHGFAISKTLSITNKERHWGIEWIFYATPFHSLFTCFIRLMQKVKWFSTAITTINARCYTAPDQAPETKLCAIKMLKVQKYKDLR